VVFTGFLQYIDDYMFNVGSSALPYEPYSETKYLDPTVKVDGDNITSVPESAIPDVYRKKSILITKDDVDFIEEVVSPNMFNPNDPDVAMGQYVRADTGTLLSNDSYNASGFIDISSFPVGTKFTQSDMRTGFFYN